MDGRNTHVKVRLFGNTMDFDWCLCKTILHDDAYPLIKTNLRYL